MSKRRASENSPNKRGKHSSSSSTTPTPATAQASPSSLGAGDFLPSPMTDGSPISRAVVQSAFAEAKASLAAITSTALGEGKASGKNATEKRVELSKELAKFSAQMTVVKSVLRNQASCLLHSQGKTQKVKEAAEDSNLLLQNILYEKLHILQEIRKCQAYRSRLEDVSLVSDEEMTATSIGRDFLEQEGEHSDHDITLKRIEVEAAERLRLKRDLEELMVRKNTIRAVTLKKRNVLQNAPAQIAKFIKDCENARATFGQLFHRKIDAITSFEEQAAKSLPILGKCNARDLPQPLYTLFMAVGGFNAANNPSSTSKAPASVAGEGNESAHDSVVAHEWSCKLTPSSSSSRGGSTTNEKSEVEAEAVALATSVEQFNTNLRACEKFIQELTSPAIKSPSAARTPSPFSATAADSTTTSAMEVDADDGDDAGSDNGEGNGDESADGNAVENRPAATTRSNDGDDDDDDDDDRDDGGVVGDTGAMTLQQAREFVFEPHPLSIVLSCKLQASGSSRVSTEPDFSVKFLHYPMLNVVTAAPEGKEAGQQATADVLRVVLGENLGSLASAQKRFSPFVSDAVLFTLDKLGVSSEPDTCVAGTIYPQIQQFSGITARSGLSFRSSFSKLLQDFRDVLKTSATVSSTISELASKRIPKVAESFERFPLKGVAYVSSYEKLPPKPAHIASFAFTLRNKMVSLRVEMDVPATFPSRPATATLSFPNNAPPGLRSQYANLLAMKQEVERTSDFSLDGNASNSGAADETGIALALQVRRAQMCVDLLVELLENIRNDTPSKWCKSIYNGREHVLPFAWDASERLFVAN